jgi:hypothetical protein
MSRAVIRTTKRINRSICLPFEEGDYDQNIQDSTEFRRCIDDQIRLYPELFPPEITKGYSMKDSHFSKKLKLTTRRISVSGVAYTIRPSFIMPYMTGKTDEIEKALFLRKFGVPYWAISYVFGKNAMNWYRKEKALGRNSIVGTTIRNPEDIPKHIAADEKHTKLLGNKVYIATTVGNECILGTEISNDAGDEALTKSYKVFKDECQNIKPAYAPETVNIDGWKSTNNAWSFLFKSVIIICCFLHIFIKIRDRGKKKYKDLFIQVSSKLWESYRAITKRSFSQRIRRLHEWCEKKEVPDVFQKPIKKIRKNISAYNNIYDHPGAHRTSNMLDRLMQRMDRHLFSAQYFHGSQESANLSIRGWALIQNFAPSNPRTVKIHNGHKSPAERLNIFQYHDNWLQNLLISASLGGYRKPPLKTL